MGFLFFSFLFLTSLVMGDFFFRRARILARHRQKETLCVFVRGQHGSTPAVQSVGTRGEADKQSVQRKFLSL